MGRKTGSKNKSVTSPAIKEPYVYAVLKILKQAGLDATKKFDSDGKRCADCFDPLWEEWLETKTYKQGLLRTDPLTVACGIASYLGS